MAISRRQFFKFLGSGDRSERARKNRIEQIEAYVRTNLLPYDFALDGAQTEQLFAQVRESVSSLDDADLHSSYVLSIVHAITASMIDPWRELRWKADERRRTAEDYVTEFLTAEASAEGIQNLRNRFNIPYPQVVEDEVRRQVQSWLCGLADSTVAEHTPESLRELVFSELRSWC
jgi:hypothetical protein